MGVNVVARGDRRRGVRRTLLPWSWPACLPAADWRINMGRQAETGCCGVCYTLMLAVMILSWSAKLRTHSSRVRKEGTFGQLLPFLFPFLSANQATATWV